VIWTVYIDEADSHAAPVMAMGGFLSLADKWQDFDQRWIGTLLYSHNVSHSHTVDLVHKKKEFLPKPRKPPEDSMYGVLLRACVSFSLAAVSLQLNEHVENEVVNFVLEKGGTKPDYARQLFQRFKSDPLADPILRTMLGELHFADKRKSPGCQAADLMLGGAIRQERTEHGVRPSLIEHSSLADTAQPVDAEDVPTFRIPVTRTVLESLRENMFAEADIRREWWQSRHHRD
jgi:hypothetical protein